MTSASTLHSCTKCSKKFSDVLYLNKHEKRQHPELLAAATLSQEGSEGEVIEDDTAAVVSFY